MTKQRNSDFIVTKVFEVEREDPTDQVDDWGEEQATTIHKNAIKEIRAIAAMSGERRATLVSLSGVDLGKAFLLEDDMTSIGRGMDCDLRVDDDSISRKHAEIMALPNDKYLLRDLGSTNGTFIGKDRIREKILEEGDRVVFGLRSVYKVVYQDNLEQAYQHALYSSSVRDPLTRVFNRKYLDDKLRVDLSFFRRQNIHLSVLMLDVDHFKKVNDEYSHQTGDAVLKAVTDTMVELSRTEDTVGRYGGEEFVVLAPSTDLEGAIFMAERIRERISKLVLTSVEDDWIEFGITASIGVVTAEPRDNPSVEDLYSVTDKNLYQAKNKGRNLVIATVFDKSTIDNED